MTDSSGPAELSETERRVLEGLQTHWGVDYDFNEVARHLSAFRSGVESLDFTEFVHMEPEKRAAAQLAQFPDDLDDDISGQSQDEVTLSRIFQLTSRSWQVSISWSGLIRTGCTNRPSKRSSSWTGSNLEGRSIFSGNSLPATTDPH